MVFNGWSFQQNKIFGEALAAFPDGLPDRWQEIVGKVAGKSAKEVYMHYEALLKDIKEIDSGKVELPSYNDVSYFRENSPEKFSYGSFESRQVPATCKMGRKKGSPWTEVQHRLFLLGLQKCGKGDWKSISRTFVLTLNPNSSKSCSKVFCRTKGVGGEKREKKCKHPRYECG